MNKTLNLVKRCGRRFGIAVSYYPPPGSLDRHLREFLSQMAVNVVLDVGANVGGFARRVRELGYRGRIVSFEPVRATFEQLRANMCRDSLWRGERLGLSDEDREADIHVHSKAGFDSLLTLRREAERAYGLDLAAEGRETIQLRRLDSVLPELIDGVRSPRVFLKLDTQGHDVSIVKGASGALGTVIGLQSELPAIELYDGMVPMPAALQYYSSLGFVPIGFYPVNTFGRVQISPEFDVLLHRFGDALPTIE